MADVKKKNTSKSEHIASRNIHAVQVDDRDKANPQLVMSFDDNGDEHYLPITKTVYDMVKEGYGLSHPRLRFGLLNGSKFRFSLVVNEVKTKKSAEPKRTITAIHVIPDYPYNQCDWAEELGMRVTEDSAIIEVQPETGAICVKAFPNKMTDDLDGFVRAVEQLSSISGSTSFKTGSMRYAVAGIFGNEITFRCARTSSSKIR